MKDNQKFTAVILTFKGGKVEFNDSRGFYLKDRFTVERLEDFFNKKKLIRTTSELVKGVDFGGSKAHILFRGSEVMTVEAIEFERITETQRVV